jgi:hypothetical protein
VPPFNKNNPDVVTLPDGLQYKILHAGDGPLPNPTSTVTINYRGALLDGTVFVDSAQAGHPVQYPVGGGANKGWSEALQRMPVGSKWQLYEPSDLAYGDQGSRGVPPGSTVICDLDLLAIIPPRAAVAPSMSPARPAAGAPAAGPTLTSDIIKVQGTNIELIKSEDVQKAQQQQQKP